MTFRRTRSLVLMLMLILSSVGALSGLSAAAAATPRGTPLYAAATNHVVASGNVQKVWVHTMALADVRLKVDYGNGQVITQAGKTDSGGVHLFQWTVGYSGTKVVLAHYWVYVTRGNRATATRGNFVLFPAAPLQVKLQVLTPDIHSGDTLRLHIHSKPGVTLSLRVQTPDGHTVLTQSAQTNTNGDWWVSTPHSATVSQAEALSVVVRGSSLGRQTTVQANMVLRPSLAQPSASGNPVPIAHPQSLDAARRAARAAAGGSYALAQTNAQNAVHQITVDLQVLEQWTTVAPAQGPAYYGDMLAKASTYDALIEATAVANADDSAVEARMRQVMPHKAIMVSLQEQALRAYQDGQLVMFTYVTTGRPELPTVTGHFAIYEKVTPFEFISPWPPGSPFYYAPTWIKYWMPFYSGYGLHDAWWRQRYGPGTNISGDGPGSSEPTGSHGCVNIPFDKTLWLWNWAPVHTPVVVYGGPSVTPGPAGI